MIDWSKNVGNWKDKKKPIIHTEPHMVTMINTLLANLEGEYDRTGEMAIRIDREDFPEDLALQRDMMGVYNDCAERSIAPTFENLVNGLAVLYGRKDAQTEVRAIVGGTAEVDGFKTAAGHVSDLAAWIGLDIKR
jgi:hypothetical protein